MLLPGADPVPDAQLGDVTGDTEEPENGLGWEGPLEATQSNPPAMGRDNFNWIRLLRAPSKLDVNVSRDGASPTSLGNLGQGFTTLTGKNFFYLI